MSTRHEGPTTATRALVSQLEDLVRGVVVRRRGGATPVDVTFADYGRDCRRLLAADPAEFEVVESRLVAAGGGRRVTEVALRARDPEVVVAPGAMLYAWWRNAPAAVAAASDGAPRVRYWTTPRPHAPARRHMASRAEILSDVVDLSRWQPGTPPMREPRILPRFYTAAHGAGDDLVRVHVTHVADWPDRAAAWWHRAEPGERVRAWALPHPHRVDTDAPGLAVVTGSGLAGVLAALRSGARGIHLVWGIGGKRLEPWVEDELAEHSASGALARLDLVSAPARVTEIVARYGAELRSAVEHGGWIYVSGHEAMGVAVDELVTAALGLQARARAYQDLRYIVST